MDVSSLTPTAAASPSRDSLSPQWPGQNANSSASATSTDASEAAEQADIPIFTSPVVAFDPSTGTAILEFRDSQSGQETFQVPSQKALQYSVAFAATLPDAAAETETAETSVDRPVVA